MIIVQAKTLSEQEQQELLIQLEEYLVLGSQIAQVTKEVKEMVCKDIYVEIAKNHSLI